MSKTLFNQNTFQSKNVTNSDDVQDLKVTSFKAVNAVIQNLTNTELQNATTNIATNTSNIATNTANITTNTSNIATNTSNIATNTSAIALKQDKLTSSNEGDGISISVEPLVIAFDGSISQNITTGATNTITAGELKYIDSGVTTDVKTKIDSKQNTLTAGTGLTLTGDEIKFTGGDIVSVAISTIGNIQGGALKYLEDDGFGSAQVQDVETKINSKQDTITSGDLSIGDTSGLQTALDNKQDNITSGDLSIADTNGLQTALDNKQDTITNTTTLEVGNIKTSSTTSNDFYIATKNTFDGGGVTDELVLTPSIAQGSTGEDGRLHLGGYIDSTTSTYRQTVKNNHYAGSHNFHLDHVEKYAFYNSYLNLINQSNDSTINMGVLSGLETDGYTNFVKGIRMGFAGDPTTTTGEGRGYYLGLINKADGSTGTALMAFGRDGGGGDDPNIGVAIAPATGDIYFGGELRGGGRRGGIRASLINYDNDSTNTGNFGNNSYFNIINTTESGRVGDSMFSTTTNGILTLSVGGTFRITVYNQGENVNVNDRVVAGTYLSINDGAGDWRGANAGKFGLMYLRDDNFGVGGSCSYACVVQLSSGDSIRIKTKLGVGSDNRAYDDQKTTAQINIWCQLAVELLTENNVIESL